MGIVKYFVCVGTAVFTNAVFASSCPTGYVSLDVEKHIDTTYHTFAETTFMQVEDGGCRIGGYSLMDVPDDVIAIFNGFTMGGTATLCDDGYLVNNSSCTTYTNSDCPTDYVDLALNANTMTTLTNGVCANNYSRYTINQQCDENTDDAICGILCGDGLNYTDIGTCASLCGEGFTTLRTSTGLIIPVYATKQITPSLNIRAENGNVCYVNVLPGTENNAINFRYNNMTYHTVK